VTKEKKLATINPVS